MRIADMPVRYRDFQLLKDPVPFDILMKGRDIALVQVHDMTPAGDDIVGFAGAFSWQQDLLTPLDGDCYNKGMSVCGYRWFRCDGKTCLDILVDGDW